MPSWGRSVLALSSKRLSFCHWDGEKDFFPWQVNVGFVAVIQKPFDVYGKESFTPSTMAAFRQWVNYFFAVLWMVGFIRGVSNIHLFCFDFKIALFHWWYFESCSQGSADALGLLGHWDAFLLCVYQCLQNCKELCMIHILIQLGISVRYLCATDFINSLSDNCFTLNVGSCFFKGLGSTFPKHLLCPFRFCWGILKCAF